MPTLQPVSFTSPGYDYSADQAEIQRRQKLAELLQQQASTPINPARMAGGWVIPVSPWEGAAKIGQGIASGIQNERAQQAQRSLAEKSQSDYRAMLAQGLRQLQGTPATQPGEDVSGNYMPGSLTVAPDPTAAMGTFASHPYGQALVPLAMQQIQLAQRQKMLADIVHGAGAQQPPPGVQPLPPGMQSQPIQQGTPPQAVPQQPISAAQAMQLIASGDPGLAAMGQAALKMYAIPASEQAKLDQGERHFQGVSGGTQAHLGQARELHEIPSGSAILSNQLGRSHLAETQRHNLMVEGDPATIETTAQGIASGHLQPLSGFALARPMGQQIMARVSQINPGFDPTQFQTRQKAEKDFATGKQGNTVRSFNVALDHLDTLQQAGEALKNNNMQLLNRVSNTVQTWSGGAAPTDFNAVKKIVGDEIVKAIVGSGGGVADREEAAKSISMANSPDQLNGVINRYKQLMRGQIGGLRQQYEQSTGKQDFDKFLSESGRTAAHTAPKNPGRRSSDFKVLGTE